MVDLMRSAGFGGHAGGRLPRRWQLNGAHTLPASYSPLSPIPSECHTTFFSKPASSFFVDLGSEPIAHATMSGSSSSGPSSPTVSTPISSTPTSPAIHALSLDDPTDEARKEAAKVKAEANKAFLSHHFNEAADLYSKAIDLNPKDATLWCNRAYTRIKLEEHGYGLSDASTAIELDPKYAKAYYRRATCYLQTLKYKQAIGDFRKLLALEPQNQLVRTQLDSTQKILRKTEFEKAIELEEEKSAVLRCLEIINEDKTYDGPKLAVGEDGKYQINVEFIKGMIEWFKAGKTLPRRYVWEIVLGAHAHFAQEQSLVNLDLEDGMTCDVIGDVHGTGEAHL
ncbi:hypothetical protein EW026_g2977 [Hermanssonia centrifuga]|uniref:PPP domain-containing protein n=1 Tax=Hermanssonia centrifuga TaxID=98765 RepID=A0A4S4KR84_9APHY|nr:hypothetical protein EW026_g2977 [Hermanssonia centrifuga]